MAATVADVHYIARLARLRFSKAEEEQLAAQLSRILDYVAKLDELDTAAVLPMFHVLDLHNAFRGDEARQRLSRSEALRNAPDADEQYFHVPKVIE